MKEITQAIADAILNHPTWEFDNVVDHLAREGYPGSQINVAQRSILEGIQYREEIRERGGHARG